MPPELERTVRFVNQSSEAFGFVDLIDVDGRECRLVADSTALVERALAGYVDES